MCVLIYVKYLQRRETVSDPWSWSYRSEPSDVNTGNQPGVFHKAIDPSLQPLFRIVLFFKLVYLFSIFVIK